MGAIRFSCHFFQAYVHKSVMEELKRIIDDSEITKEDDALWPSPDRVGRQVCASWFSQVERVTVDNITAVSHRKHSAWFLIGTLII